MKIPITEKLEIKDGLHKGVIIKVDYRDTPYKYTDVVIETILNDMSINLKAGYPTMVGEETKLGKLLMRFGGTMEVGTTIDPDVMLIGKECQFMTITEDTKNGKFAKVLPDSVKP